MKYLRFKPEAVLYKRFAETPVIVEPDAFVDTQITEENLAEATCGAVIVLQQESGFLVVSGRARSYDPTILINHQFEKWCWVREEALEIAVDAAKGRTLTR